MAKFQILYLRNSVLTHSEQVVGRDMLDAIDQACLRAPDTSAEVWSDKGRVAVVGPALDRDKHPSHSAAVSMSNSRVLEEAEITREMRQRLELASAHPDNPAEDRWQFPDRLAPQRRAGE